MPIFNHLTFQPSNQPVIARTSMASFTGGTGGSAALADAKEALEVGHTYRVYVGSGYADFVAYTETETNSNGREVEYTVLGDSYAGIFLKPVGHNTANPKYGISINITGGIVESGSEEVLEYVAIICLTDRFTYATTDHLLATFGVADGDLDEDTIFKVIKL